MPGRKDGHDASHNDDRKPDAVRPTLSLSRCSSFFRRKHSRFSSGSSNTKRSSKLVVGKASKGAAAARTTNSNGSGIDSGCTAILKQRQKLELVKFNKRDILRLRRKCSTIPDVSIPSLRYGTNSTKIDHLKRLEKQFLGEYVSSSDDDDVDIDNDEKEAKDDNHDDVQKNKILVNTTNKCTIPTSQHQLQGSGKPPIPSFRLADDNDSVNSCSSSDNDLDSLLEATVFSKKRDENNSTSKSISNQNNEKESLETSSPHDDAVIPSITKESHAYSTKVDSPESNHVPKAIQPEKTRVVTMTSHATSDPSRQSINLDQDGCKRAAQRMIGQTDMPPEGKDKAASTDIMDTRGGFSTKNCDGNITCTENTDQTTSESQNHRDADRNEILPANSPTLEESIDMLFVKSDKENMTVRLFNKELEQKLGFALDKKTRSIVRTRLTKLVEGDILPNVPSTPTRNEAYGKETCSPQNPSGPSVVPLQNCLPIADVDNIAQRPADATDGIVLGDKSSKSVAAMSRRHPEESDETLQGRRDGHDDIQVESLIENADRDQPRAMAHSVKEGAAGKEPGPGNGQPSFCTLELEPTREAGHAGKHLRKKVNSDTTKLSVGIPYCRPVSNAPNEFKKSSKLEEKERRPAHNNKAKLAANSSEDDCVIVEESSSKRGDNQSSKSRGEASAVSQDAAQASKKESAEIEKKTKRKRGRPPKERQNGKKSSPGAKERKSSGLNPSAAPAVARPAPARKRARKGTCALCTTCPCQNKHGESTTAAALDLTSMSRNDIAVEKALIRRVQKLEKSAEHLEEQREVVKRKLKKHRRDMWKKRQREISEADITSALQKESKKSWFLPDAEEFEAYHANGPVLAKQQVEQAQRSLFPSIPSCAGRQITLTQWLSGNKDEQTEDSVDGSAVNLASTGASQVSENATAGDSINDVNLPEQTIEDYIVRKEPVDFIYRAEWQDGSRYGVPSSQALRGPSAWGALSAIPEEGEDAKSCTSVESERRSRRASFDCSYWDRLFREESDNDRNGGIDHLLELFETGAVPSLTQLQSLSPPDVAEVDEPAGGSGVRFSMLSQGRQDVALKMEAEIRSDSAKLASLETACPNWKENIAYALHQGDEAEVREAMHNIAQQRKRMAELKQRILESWGRQTLALNVFEKALVESLGFIQKKDDGEIEPTRHYVLVEGGYLTAPSLPEEKSEDQEEFQQFTAPTSQSETPSKCAIQQENELLLEDNLVLSY